MTGLDILQATPQATGTVEVTEKAARAIEKYLKDQGAPDGAGLRIGVRGGGCSGLSYFLDADNEQKETDHVIDAFGVRVLVDPKSLLFLQGSTLDYVTGLMESGFKFLNPKAGKGCGCGESFSRSDRSSPSRQVMECWSCGAERGAALFCTTCDVIQPESRNETWFEALGLEPKMTIDRRKLDKAFRERSTKVHPDRFGQKSAVERRLAVQHTARLNDAYRTLKDPQRRAEYLMKLEGVEVGGEEQRTNDPAFLMEMMELQEAADAAKEPEAIEQMRKTVVAERDRRLGAVTQYFDDRKGEQGEIVRALDALRYYKRLIERLDAKLEK